METCNYGNYRKQAPSGTFWTPCWNQTLPFEITVANSFLALFIIDILYCLLFHSCFVRQYPEKRNGGVVISLTMSDYNVWLLKSGRMLKLSILHPQTGKEIRELMHGASALLTFSFLIKSRTKIHVIVTPTFIQGLPMPIININKTISHRPV